MITEFVDWVSSIKTGREQYRTEVHFRCDDYYLIFNRLGMRSIWIEDDNVHIVFVDNREIYFKIENDIEFWLEQTK